MMYGISGTPGTGKSAIAEELEKQGYLVVHATETAREFVIEADNERDTVVIDEEAWIASFRPFDGFVEGHLAHLLPCDLVIILRCRPDILRLRLLKRGYRAEKIEENVEAEALDVILVETLEIHSPENILEIDTTSAGIPSCVEQIVQFIRREIPSSYGKNDWSDYLETTI
ncbi:MAG: adenylate kinase family protein [Methanomicrobiales archaeon]